MTWLLNEDAAIKGKFADLSVSAPSGASQPVMVRFRSPQKEAPDLDFPIIVIDPPQVSKADDREHRGRAHLYYIPDGVDRAAVLVPHPETGDLVRWDSLDPRPERTNLYSEYPIPYNLDYTITVYTRFENHLRELVRLLAAPDRIPHRFGWLDIEADESTRYLDVLGGPELSSVKDESDKRLFTAVYYVRVTSEFILGDVSFGADTPDQVAIDVDFTEFDVAIDQN